MYALNIRKGTTIHNDDIGELKGGIAIPITSKQSLIAKHLINVVVFDSVAGISKAREVKHQYNIDPKTMKVKSNDKSNK